MSLIATTLAGIETAFTVAAEFVTPGTYTKREGNPAYDPVTDTLAANDNVVSNVRFLKVAASREEREASPVAINDAKFLVPAVDLPNLTPGESDLITINDVVYNVLVSKFVPGEVLHIIFGRRA